MTTSARQRICLRCGTRETLRHYGNLFGWEEVTKAVRGFGGVRPHHPGR